MRPTGKDKKDKPKLKRKDRISVRMSFFSLFLLVFWLMGWPTTPGPYNYSTPYFLPFLIAIPFGVLPLLLIFRKNSAGFVLFLNQSKKLLLPICGILFVLLLGEGILRLFGLAEWGGGQGPYQPGYRLRNYRINSQGYRGGDIVLADLKNKKVLLGLGDSVCFGQGVTWKETFLQQLETLLNQSGRTRYKTISAAKPGWNTVKQAEYFLNTGISYKPDILILQFTLNDPELGTYYLKSLTPFAWESHLWRSHFYFYLVKIINSIRTPYEDYIQGLFNEDKPHWPYFQKALWSIGKTCQTQKIKPYLVLYPILQDQKLGQYDFTGAHEKVANLGRAYGFEVIDLLEAFQKYPQTTKTLRVSSGDWHPNAKGHRLAAQTVFERLNREITTD